MTAKNIIYNFNTDLDTFFFTFYESLYCEHVFWSNGKQTFF